MTDLPMDQTEHPDEGLIHAWLDDALDAAEGERIAAHVRTCDECQARVAEALDLSLASVGTTLSRARRRLMEAYESLQHERSAERA